MKLLAAGALLVGLACLSHARARVWESDLSLWRETVKTSPLSPRVHNNLGRAYSLLGQYQRALDEWQLELRLAEDTRRSPYQRGFSQVVATANIAYLLLNLGAVEEAKRLLDALLIVAPNFAPVRFNYAAYLAFTGQCEAAVQEYAAAMTYDRWMTPPRLACHAGTR